MPKLIVRVRGKMPTTGVKEIVLFIFCIITPLTSTAVSVPLANENELHIQESVLRTKEISSPLHSVPAIGLPASLLPDQENALDINQNQNLKYNKSRIIKRPRRSPYIWYYQTQETVIKCPISQHLLQQFQRTLQIISDSLHESNPNVTNSAVSTTETPSEPHTPHLKIFTESECDHFSSRDLNTIQEIFAYIAKLSEIQTSGEVYFQNLTQNQNAELSRMELSHHASLQDIDASHIYRNNYLLAQIQTLKEEIRTLSLTNPLLQQFELQRKEMAAKLNFLSSCNASAQGTFGNNENWEEADFVRNQENEDDSDYIIDFFPSRETNKPAIYRECEIPAKNLEQIINVADNSTRLILEISKYNSRINFQNNSYQISDQKTCRTGVRTVGNAIGQLKSMVNYVPSDLRENSARRIEAATSAHSRRIFDLTEQFQEQKEMLESRYRSNRTQFLSDIKSYEEHKERLHNENVGLIIAETIKIRQFALNLVACNQTAWAVYVLHQYETTFKNHDKFISPAKLRDGIYPWNTPTIHNYLVSLPLNSNTIMSYDEAMETFETVVEELKSRHDSKILFLNMADQLEAMETLHNSSCKNSNETRYISDFRNFHNHNECIDREKVFHSVSEKTHQRVHGILKGMVYNVMHVWEFPLLNYDNDGNATLKEGADQYFSKLITVAYAEHKVKSVEPILTVLSSISQPEVRASTYSQILQLVQDNDDVDSNFEIFKLAVSIRSDIAEFHNNNSNNNTNQSEILQTLESTKAALPACAHNLIFPEHGYVIIQSKLAPAYTLAGTKAGNIHASNRKKLGRNQKWKAHALENARYFAFENVGNGRALYEETTAVGGRSVKGAELSLTDQWQHWELTLANNGTQVKLRNRQSGNYLSTGGLTNMKSSNFGNKIAIQTLPENNNGDSQEWTIIN